MKNHSKNCRSKLFAIASTILIIPCFCFAAGYCFNMGPFTCHAPTSNQSECLSITTTLGSYEKCKGNFESGSVGCQESGTQALCVWSRTVTEIHNFTIGSAEWQVCKLQLLRDGPAGTTYTTNYYAGLEPKPQTCP